MVDIRDGSHSSQYSDGADSSPAQENITHHIDAQVRALYDHFEAITFAPAAGGLFTTWVLWGHANDTALATLISLVLLISAVRLVGLNVYRKQHASGPLPKFWGRFAITTALLSGLLWGSFAIFVYPDVDQSYQIYMIILMALVPVAPVAALATYLPSFYAYFLPSTLPFLFVLVSDGTRQGITSGILLTILMFATLQFATSFHRSLAVADALRRQARINEKRVTESLEARTQFMIDANHDLRQPLQALDLCLGKPTASSIPSDNQLHIARLAVSTLNHYLERLREVTQFETGTVRSTPEAFLLNPVIERHVATLAPIADEKSVQLRHVPTTLAVYCEQDGFELILRNLLSNAVEHAGRGSRVVVGCRRQGNSIKTSVIDNGVGIAAKDQERIFDDFVQLKNTVRDKRHGIGLGLSIARRSAVHVGADLVLTSEQGKGSNFSVVVPWADPAAIPLPDETDEIRSDTTNPLRLMIIDGEHGIREGLTRLIGSWGHDVRAFAGTETALDAIQNGFEPDVVLVDYRLEEGRTGFDAWDQIDQATQGMPTCMIMTGDTDRSIEVRSEDAGHFYFLKPVDVDALAAVLETVSPSA